MGLAGPIELELRAQSSSSELHRTGAGVAPPENSVTKSRTDCTLRHEVDRLAWASSTSSESGSLELLLALHALAGAAVQQHTNGCSPAGRA